MLFLFAVLAYMLPAPLFAQRPERAVVFTDVNVIPLAHEGVEQGRTVLVRGDRIAGVGKRDEVQIPSDAVVIDGAGQYLVPGLTDSHVHLPDRPIPWARTRADFGDAPIYLAYGVTTVVNLGGNPEQLEWRNRVEAGTLLGPTIYTAGPFVNEPRVNTPDDVERDIVSQAQIGYDLIKFHQLPGTTTGLSLSAYRRMVETARRIRIPLIGHAPVNLGIDEMLRARQSIAHIGMLSDIYFLPLSSRVRVLIITAVASLILIGMALTSAVAAVIRRRSRGVGCSQSAVRAITKVTAVIALTAVAALVCVFTFLPGSPLFDTTLLRVVFTVLVGILVGATLFALFSGVHVLRDTAAPALRKIQALLAVVSAVALSVLMLAFWVPVSWRSSDRGIDRVAKRVHEAGAFVQSTLIVYNTASTDGRIALINDPAVNFLLPSTRDAWQQESENGIPFSRLTGFMQKVTGALYRNGVPIMAGTDAMGMPLIAPGSSLHREFQLLSASGLSPYEVLRSATVVPAAFLGKSKEFGTIAVGQRADLLLVSGNPLENLLVLKRPNGVMARGRWLPRQELDELLTQLARNK